MTLSRKTAVASAVLALACHAHAEQPEELTVQKMPAWHPHEIFVVDGALTSMTDGRVHVYDADASRLLGQIDTGYAAGFAISPDHRTSYTATTYFSRGSHGARTDVVEFTDNATLSLGGEIVIPPKHAQMMPSPWNTAFSSDGKLLYVTNITPSTSVSVVDVQAKKVLSEIDTAACVLALPSGNHKFTSLCESGKALTFMLDAHGKEIKRSMSDPFIDVEHDPVFANAARYQGTYLFTSFHGMVRSADFRGDKAVFGTPWPLVTDAEREQGWRPGGVQQTAVQEKTHRLYVAMHQGADGSHKDPASEIWVFDLNTHKRIARWNLAQMKIDPVLSIQVSQDEKPLFYGLTATAALAVFDAQTGKLRHVEPHLGSTPLLLVNP